MSSNSEYYIGTLTRNGEVVQVKKANNLGSINNQVEKWKQLYGKRFSECSLNIQYPEKSKKVKAAELVYKKEKSIFKKGSVAKKYAINKSRHHKINRPPSLPDF